MRGIDAHGEAIRQTRMAKAWTQEQLATAAACDSRTIRNAEGGKRIDGETLKHIAASLGVSLSAISAVGNDQQQQHIETVRKWTDAFFEADVERLLSFHHPETILELPGAEVMPGFPEPARFCGLEALRDHFEVVFSDFRWLELLQNELDTKGNLVFHRSECRFLGLKTGRTATTKFYNEFEFSGGLIIRRMTISDLGGHRSVMGLE